MKNANKIILSFVGAVLFFCSCKEDALMTYDRSDNVYFRNKKWTEATGLTGVYVTTIEYQGIEYTSTTKTQVDEARDSIYFSFRSGVVSEDATSAITIVPVSIVGKMSDVDRRFGYKVLESTFAEEGEDYRILDAFIPANQLHGAIVVELFKKNVIEKDTYRYIDFQLIANDNFTAQYDSITRSKTKDTEIVSMIDFRLTFDNALVPPARWTSYNLGVYSALKAELYMQVTGVTMDQLEGIVDPPLRVYTEALKLMFQTWLDAERVAGREVLEADGTPMILYRP